jgi:hypothetical protein
MRIVPKAKEVTPVRPDFWFRTGRTGPSRLSIPTSTAIVPVSQEIAFLIQMIKNMRYGLLLALNAGSLRPGVENDWEERTRKESELVALFHLMDPKKLELADRLVELAAGTSDISLIAKTRQPDLEVVSLELKPNPVEVGKSLARSLGITISSQVGDLSRAEIPGGVWVAKHACGQLTDLIIDMWKQRTDSPLLFLMTCCHGSAKKSKPRYGLGVEEWKSLCQQSDWTGCSDPRKIEVGRRSMDRLDALRIDHLNRSPNVRAAIYSVEDVLDVLMIPHPPIFKGNIIVAERG